MSLVKPSSSQFTKDNLHKSTQFGHLFMAGIARNDATWGPKWTKVFQKQVWIESNPAASVSCKRDFLATRYKKDIFERSASLQLQNSCGVPTLHSTKYISANLGAPTHDRRSLPSFLRGFCSLFVALKLCLTCEWIEWKNRFYKQTCYTRYTMVYHEHLESVSPRALWSCPAPRRSPAVRRDSHHGPLSKYPSRSCRQQYDLSKMGKRFGPLNFAGYKYINILYYNKKNTWSLDALFMIFCMILLLYRGNSQEPLTIRLDVDGDTIEW